MAATHWRLFWAIPLDEASRRAVAEQARELTRGLRGWRVLPADGLHLTLRFLGPTPEQRVAELLASAREALAGIARFRVTLAGAWDVLPGARRPRVLVAGVTDGAQPLVEIAARLEDAAVALGWPPETRPFRPHLTVARVRRGVRRPDLPAPDAGPRPTAFDAVDVVLFRSHLEPGGARYERIAAVPLEERR